MKVRTPRPMLSAVDSFCRTSRTWAVVSWALVNARRIAADAAVGETPVVVGVAVALGVTTAVLLGVGCLAGSLPDEHPATPVRPSRASTAAAVVVVRARM